MAPSEPLRADRRRSHRLAADAARSPDPAPAAPADPSPPLIPADPTFAHPVEAEFARLLDFYQVAWCYEPDTFPLQWAEDGHVTAMFRPDFYLPDYDCYIECTVMKQSLVRRKTRKLRRLRELRPDIQIKLLYRRDFHRLAAGLGFSLALLGPGEADSAPERAEPAA